MGAMCPGKAANPTAISNAKKLPQDLSASSNKNGSGRASTEESPSKKNNLKSVSFAEKLHQDDPVEPAKPNHRESHVHPKGHVHPHNHSHDHDHKHDNHEKHDHSHSHGGQDGHHHADKKEGDINVDDGPHHHESPNDTI
jgi:hypothetical protein